LPFGRRLATEQVGQRALGEGGPAPAVIIATAQSIAVRNRVIEASLAAL